MYKLFDFIQRYLLPLEQEESIVVPPPAEDLMNIPGTPEYGITQDGRVWSYARRGMRTGRWLSPRNNGKGISLNINGKSKSYTIKYLLSVTWEKNKNG